MVIQIDDSYVSSAAPNADAAKNGRALVVKKKFFDLSLSEGSDLLFGKCQGSGKLPYECSCDFANPENPTHRCSCPSRQFPCKHCIGLMYAFVQAPSSFTVQPVPEDLQSKRDKAADRIEKKKETSSQPKKVNKSALAKKLKAQLEGLELLDKLTDYLLGLGLGNMNTKSLYEIDLQAKQLGDMYLPGAQNALRSFITLFSLADIESEEDSSERDRVFSEAFERLSLLRAISKEGKVYLQKRLDDPELAQDTESRIAEWLGHAWQLSELREAGLVIPNSELLQLAFHTYNDIGREEYIDSGLWFELTSNRVFVTKNYRPYRAAKHIKAEDSFYQIALSKELFVYPGDFNPRVRWEGMTTRPATSDDYSKLHQSADRDYTALVKKIKGVLKGPLSEKQPICTLHFKKMGKVDDQYVVEDEHGNRLVLSDRGVAEEPSTLPLLCMLPQELHSDQVLVGRFLQDLDTLKLTVKPLAIATLSSIVRLAF